MDLHQRKGGRIALPNADLNIRSCIPSSFCPPGKQSCSIPNKPMQDALIPIQHSSCATQAFPFDQGPPAPPMIPHESLNQHQDIEYITLPVYKTRKNEPQQHFNQSDLSVLDGRFHQDGNPALDLRTIQNISYPAMPEPHPPYFCLAQSGIRPRNPLHQETQKFMAFQPPPRSPRREPTARALVSQHNSHYNYTEKEFEAKGDESMYYPKNFMVNIPSRRPSSDVQLPIPFQWMEVNANQNKQKLNQNALMKPIPEKIESNSHLTFRRCQDYEMFPDKPMQVPIENDDKNFLKSRHLQDNYLYFANKKFVSDHSFNKLSSTPIKSSYKVSKKKCFHKYDSKQESRGAFPGDYAKKFSASRSDNAREGLHTDNYLSPLNFSTTSNSSLDSLSHSSTHRSRNLKNLKCTCSEDSDRFSTKKSKMSKGSPKSTYSVGNQTDFLKSPIEEKFLFRETILFGCDEIGKWARKLPMASEIAAIGDYIREKTTQSRAQNICSALGLEIEDQVIVSGYLKVFLKVADSWLEARNCFGLTENCMKKSCQLNSPEISQNYLEWQHASRRLLGNIIHGVGSVLAPKESNVLVNGPEVTNYVNQNVLFNFGANENANGNNKVDCRLTRSASSLQKYYNNKFPSTPNKRPFLQRQKWTISDTASTTSQCSSGIRGPSQATDLNTTTNATRNCQNQTNATENSVPYPTESHPVLLSELPQHKITPLGQVEPPALRKQENPCLTIDISAWFSGKNGDGVNRCLSSLTKEGTLNMSRFAMAPPPIKPLAKPMTVYQKPMNIQKSQSVTVVYAANEGSQDSSDDIQQKIYMKPGSYNVPKKKLTNAKKRNNVQKAKESCCEDTEIPSGYIIPFVNAGPFVPPPSRGLQNPNIKIVKNITAQSENLINLGFKSEENLKIISKSDNAEDEKNHGGFDGKDSDRNIQKKETLNQGKVLESNSKQNKIPTKTMKTDEWILSTLINSRAMRPQMGKGEGGNDEKDLRNSNKSPQLGKSAYDKLGSSGCMLSKPNMHQIDGQEKSSDKGQEASQSSQGHEASQSQASSDKSSHGIDESMTNRSQSSIASRSISKASNKNKSVWHNSKRRRILSQRTFLRIQDIVNSLWNYDIPDYLKQAVKTPVSQLTVATNNDHKTT